jgi:hypothetical protein
VRCTTNQSQPGARSREGLINYMRVPFAVALTLSLSDGGVCNLAVRRWYALKHRRRDVADSSVNLFLARVLTCIQEATRVYVRYDRSIPSIRAISF